MPARNGIGAPSVTAASHSWLQPLPLSAFEELATESVNVRHFASLIDENNDMAIAATRDLINPDARSRIAARLLAIFGGDPDSGGSVIAITQADLAHLCNVSRKTIDQELGRLETIGAISRAYGQLVLRDPEKLAQVAEAERAVAKDGPAVPAQSIYL